MNHLGIKMLEAERLILRQAGKNNQGPCDACVYSILAEDWRKKH